jgi:ATPase family AAA domain-containing protein 1
MDDIISLLRESVIIPLLHPAISRSPSTLLAPPKGVILYGPPGCGKTMLAKALAKESGATVINVTGSVLMDKGCDESTKVVAGLFSLARKMQPSIIFIDEIDSILRERRKDDSQGIAMMKAQFMTYVISTRFFIMCLASHNDHSLWDGLLSGSDQILILGTTNRRRDIDPAFLRRMPRQILISMPNAVQREKILPLVSPPTDASVRFAPFLDALCFFAGRQYSRCVTDIHPSYSRTYRLRLDFLCDFWPSTPRESPGPI